MSRKGDCWDNAVAESFFNNIKIEWISLRPVITLRVIRFAVIRFAVILGLRPVIKLRCQLRFARHCASLSLRFVRQ
jgi:transposase InsO family protein